MNYDYLYTATAGTCKLQNNWLGKVGSVDITWAGTKTADIVAAITLQPQAVAVAAGTNYFQSYASGILTDAS